MINGESQVPSQLPLLLERRTFRARTRALFRVLVWIFACTDRALRVTPFAWRCDSVQSAQVMLTHVGPFILAGRRK